MKVEINIRGGRVITTKFEADLSDLVDHLSRILGEATDDSVVELKTEDGVFLVRPTDIVSVEIHN